MLVIDVMDEIQPSQPRRPTAYQRGGTDAVAFLH